MGHADRLRAHPVELLGVLEGRLGAAVAHRVDHRADPLDDGVDVDRRPREERPQLGGGGDGGTQVDPGQHGSRVGASGM
jgi:hypothetical protein